MKEQTAKKQPRWLLPVILLAAVLVVAGAVLAIIGVGGQQAAEPTVQETEPQANAGGAIYWNVEREKYVSSGTNGYSARSSRDDGYYYVRFAVDGEQVDLPVADQNLTTRIDMQKAMGLVFDENGVVVDILPVHTFTGGAVAESLYVESVDGNTVVANNHMGNEGISFTITLDENTKIYNGSGDTALAGMVCGISEGDAIYAIKTLDGSIGWVYVDPYIPPGDVYWNIERMYDTTAKTTTRGRNELGFFEFQMALNGEAVTLYTRDLEVATKVDSYVAKCMGLEFDEDGYIINAVGTSARGCPGPFGSWSFVTSIDGRNVTSLKMSGSNAGQVYDGVLSKDCKIIDVSANGGYSGAYTEIRYGDQIHGLYDKRGQVCYVFVIGRLTNTPMYLNVKREYDTTAKTTKRYPDAEGYYHLLVSANGKQMTVKTKDLKIVNQIDSYAARLFSMELDGDVITKYYSASNVYGGGIFGSYYYVDKIEGNKVTVKRILDGDTVPTYQTGVLAEDCQIVNGSTTNYISHTGEFTTLQVGDRVHGYKDLEGNIRYLLVVEKPIDSPVYWNISRQYSTSKKMSTRERAEDGYFYFTMAANGKQVVLKTKDQAVCNSVDSNAARCWGLKLSGDVILKTVSVTSIRGLSGGTKKMSWVDVTAVNGKSYTAQKNQAGHADDGKVFNDTMAYGCKIYDVSDGYNKFCGEETTLRVGDRVHVLHDGDGYAKVIFVVGGRTRQLDRAAEDCPCTNGTVKWEPWDGTTELKNGKYYYLTQDVVAPKEGFYLENMQVSLRLDGHTISSEGRCFYLHTGGKLNICDHGTRGKLVGSGVKGESGGVIRMYTSSNGAFLKIWNVDIEAKPVEDALPTEGGALSLSGAAELNNVNVSGGRATSSGGNIRVQTGGTLRMFGGSLSGGRSSSGGNMIIAGTAYLEGVTFKSSQGNQLTINSTKQLLFKDVTVEDVSGAEVNFNKGTLGVRGKISIPQMNMSAGTVMEDKGLDQAASIAVAAGDQVILKGAKSDLTGAVHAAEADEYKTIYDAKAGTISLKYTVVPMAHSGDHCLCNGKVTGDHTCATLTDWTKITDACFEDAIGTDGKKQGIKFIKDGNYYLETGYKLPSTLCVMAGQNINICLNGNKLSRVGGRAGVIAGTLNITDCREGGKLMGTSTSNGGTFKLVNGGKLNLFAGTLTYNGTVSSDGGVVMISTDSGYVVDNETKIPSAFTMYGGTVTGGTATNGGNITIWHKGCSFIMYDGTLSGGTATKLGGNLDVYHTAAEVKLLGGTITGGSAEKGGGIYTLAPITLGGNVNLSGNAGTDLYVNGEGVKLEDYTSDKICVVGMNGSGLFAYADTDLSAFFKGYDSEYSVRYISGALYLLSASDIQDHCICGGHGAGAAAHTCEDYKDIVWIKWTDTKTLPTVSGYYYLAEDVNLTARTNIGSTTADAKVNICLNGKKINSPATNGAFSVHGTLTITDCKDTGKVTSACTNRAEGGLIYISNNGKEEPCLNLYAGTLEHTGSVSDFGGLIVMGNGQTKDVTVNIYGGMLTGGKASGKGGGAIYMNTRTSHTQTVNIYGGIFTNNHATGASGHGGVIGIRDASHADYANINIYGGEFTGNTAALGGDLDGYTVPKLSGSPKIGDLYLKDGQTLEVSGLTEGAKIGITMAVPGVFAENVAADLSGYFTSADITYQVIYSESNQTLALEPLPHMDHCVCGGKATGVGDHTACAVLTDWKELTTSSFTTSGDNLRLADGNYYLETDLSLTKAVEIIPGQNITICLNGHSITDSKRMFRVNGILNITDCKDTGKLIGKNSLAPVFYGYAGGHINLYAGELSTAYTGTSSYWGGVAALAKDKGAASAGAPSSFTMYGGTIVGGNTRPNSSGTYGTSGSLWVISNCTFTMYDGTITGGTAQVRGGNVYADNNAILKLLGGTIEEGTAPKGGDLCLGGTSVDLTLGGNMKIGDLYLPDGMKLDVSGLTEGAKIGITMAKPGVFAENVETDLSSWFTSNDILYAVTYSQADQTLSLTADLSIHAHCACGGKAKDLGDHACTDPVGWIPITDDLFEEVVGTNDKVQGVQFKADGSYYLTGDYSITKAICIMPGQNINLCLNGHTLSVTGMKALVVAGNLNITDCQEAEGTVTSNYTGNGAALKLVKGSTANIYAGTFAGKGQTCEAGGLVVVSTDSGYITSAGGPSTLTMYGGTITGGKVAGKGANVFVMHKGCVFTMYGGTISNGIAEKDSKGANGHGGNLCAATDGIMNLLGGTITGGTAAAKGQDVYAYKASNITLGGDVKIGDLYVETNYVLGDISGLTEGAQIGITMASNTGDFAKNVETDMRQFFFSTKPEYSVAWFNKILSLAAG